MDFNFKNYYLTMFGDLEEIDSLISLLNFIHEVNLDYKLEKGFMVCSFSSFLNRKEIEVLLADFKDDFILVELSDNISWNFKNGKIDKNFFSNLESEETDLKDMTNKLIDEIGKTSKNETHAFDINKDFLKNFRKNKKQRRFKSEYYKNLSKQEKEEMVNKILDKGPENITDYDRRVLSIISKKK